MTLKIAHFMTRKVILAATTYSIGRVREIMTRNRIHAVPVVGTRKELRGIVTSADLARDWDVAEPVVRAMSKDVQTLEAATDVREAARIMRQHRIHHIVVVDKKAAVGVLSSFDLLKLVQDGNFDTAASGASTDQQASG